MTTTSVFAMTDLPVIPTPSPVTPFHPNYPVNQTQPPGPARQNSGEISAQAIAKGQPGTAFSYVRTFGTTDVAYFDNPTSSDNTVYLNSPNGITADSDGNVYVVEEYGARLLKFDKDKNLLWKVGTAGFRDWGATGLNQPVGVAMDPDGKSVWVTDQDHISKFDPANGDSLLQFPEQPWNADDNTRFGQLRGIAFDTSGRMYLADGNRQRIQVFTFDGDGNPVYAATIGQTDNGGNSNSQFNWPDGIAIDSSNNVFVADRNNSRVQECTPDTSTTWNCSTIDGIGNGDSGSDVNQLNNPGGLWIDKADNIYIADTNNSRVMKCTPAIPITCNELMTNIGNVTSGMASNGDIFINLYDQSVIAEYDTDGNYVQNFAGTAGVPYLTDTLHYNAARCCCSRFKGQYHPGRTIG